MRVNDPVSFHRSRTLSFVCNEYFVRVFKQYVKMADGRSHLIAINNRLINTYLAINELMANDFFQSKLIITTIIIIRIIHKLKKQ